MLWQGVSLGKLCHNLVAGFHVLFPHLFASGKSRPIGNLQKSPFSPSYEKFLLRLFAFFLIARPARGHDVFDFVAAASRNRYKMIFGADKQSIVVTDENGSAPIAAVSATLNLRSPFARSV